MRRRASRNRCAEFTFGSEHRRFDPARWAVNGISIGAMQGNNGRALFLRRDHLIGRRVDDRNIVRTAVAT
jgi:hypothetical protein